MKYKVGDKVVIREDANMERGYWTSRDEHCIGEDRVIEIESYCHDLNRCSYIRSDGVKTFFDTPAIKELVMDVIERLKKNEKPFCLMDEEMQEKMEEMQDSGDLECLQSSSKRNEPDWYKIKSLRLGLSSNSTNTYRLVDSYTEPKVKEMTVQEISDKLGYEVKVVK